jgi:hypothetical protein
MEGAELAQAQERANILSTLRDASLVSASETVELADSDGEPCWRVRLVWASGSESLDCYSRDTGLLLASENTEVTPMGEMVVTHRFSEYEPFYGMMLPTRLVQSALGQVQGGRARRRGRSRACAPTRHPDAPRRRDPPITERYNGSHP